MTERTIDFSGEIVAANVAEAEYLRDFAQDFCEYIEGFVIKMSPVTETHDRITYFLRQYIAAYLELRPVGQVRSAPFTLKLPNDVNRWREPDLMVILNQNDGDLQPTFFHGAPDVVIEVVSPESVRRDYGEKFLEYERSGAHEYWLIDPERRNAQFYHLSASGKYQPRALDGSGYYESACLDGLRLEAALLWRDALPGPLETARLVQSLLGGA